MVNTIKIYFDMTIQFKKWLCELNFSAYENGNPALTLTERSGNELIAVCTVNLPSLKEDELAIKDYSENESMYKTLLEYKIIKAAHRFLSSGYIKNIPVCYFNWEVGSYD